MTYASWTGKEFFRSYQWDDNSQYAGLKFSLVSILQEIETKILLSLNQSEQSWFSGFVNADVMNILLKESENMNSTFRGVTGAPGPAGHPGYQELRENPAVLVILDLLVLQAEMVQ